MMAMTRAAADNPGFTSSGVTSVASYNAGRRQATPHHFGWGNFQCFHDLLAQLFQFGQPGFEMSRGGDGGELHLGDGCQSLLKRTHWDLQQH
jgi:hypothetical protein